MAATTISNGDGFELRFRSLSGTGQGVAFPCDAAGRVNMDAMSDRVRNTYLYARAVIGREFALPAVQRSA